MTNGPFHLVHGTMATSGTTSPDALTAIVEAAFPAGTLPVQTAISVVGDEHATDDGEEGEHGHGMREGVASEHGSSGRHLAADMVASRRTEAPPHCERHDPSGF